MLISMVFASCIQSDWGKVTVKDLRWETTMGYKMSGLLFVPAGVSAENKAPAIVVSHGMFNNREMQDAKRTWVNTAVLAVFAAIPPVALLAIQYATFFSTGFLAWSVGHMQIVWLFPVVVFLPVTTIISRRIFRETGNPYLPGIINGVLVTLIACSNTLTWL